jgi:hypothetical protein
MRAPFSIAQLKQAVRVAKTGGLLIGSMGRESEVEVDASWANLSEVQARRGGGADTGAVAIDTEVVTADKRRVWYE